jgi:hypothetical protein
MQRCLALYVYLTRLALSPTERRSYSLCSRWIDLDFGTNRNSLALSCCALFLSLAVLARFVCSICLLDISLDVLSRSLSMQSLAVHSRCSVDALLLCSLAVLDYSITWMSKTQLL